MQYTTVLTAGYHPLPVPGVFAVTVTATPATLGALLAAAGAAIPVYSDKSLPASSPIANRFPRHVIFQSTGGNANSIYITWDGQTAPNSTPNPVVGWELTPGGYVKFEDGYALLENAINGGRILPDNDTAFQFVADAETALNVIFSD